MLLVELEYSKVWGLDCTGLRGIVSTLYGFPKAVRSHVAVLDNLSIP